MESVPRFLELYRQRLVAAYTGWDLGPVQAALRGGQGWSVGLDLIIQPLRLAEGYDPGVTERGDCLDPDTLLRREKPLMLRGGAGSGKTTWMRWMFRRLLAREDALPVMLELRTLARAWRRGGEGGFGRCLDEALEDWMVGHLGEDCRGALGAFLRQPGAVRPVLLVDGWDELGPLGADLRGRLLGFIRAMSPRLLVVVSSRPYGVQPPSHSDGFEVLDIQPLGQEEIERFAQTFYAALYPSHPERALQDAVRFSEALRLCPDVAALARQMLLLTMMLLIHRFRPLPDKRHQLYALCLETLLEGLPQMRVDAGVPLPEDLWYPEAASTRMEVVTTLAWSLQDHVAQGASRRLLVVSWEAMVQRLPDEWGGRQRRGFLRWLTGPAGLLQDRSDGSLSMSHLSFQEFLVARHLLLTVEGMEGRLGLCQRYGESLSWWETLRLWAAQLEAGDPTLLQPVLDELIMASGEGFWLAGSFLADGLGEETSFRRWSMRLETSLSRPWTHTMAACAHAWSSSRQASRRLVLREVLETLQSRAHWLTWLRGREWASDARLAWERTQGGCEEVTEAFLDALRGDFTRPEEVAMGRLFSSAHALWPVQPWPLALLQLWPTRRRAVSSSLQALISLGASETLFLAIAEALLAPLAPAQQVLGRMLRMRLGQEARESSSGLPMPLHRAVVEHRVETIAEAMVRCASQEEALPLALGVMHSLPIDLKLHCDVNLARYLTRYFVRDLARASGQELHHAQMLARSWCARTGCYEEEELLTTFFSLEVYALGRADAATVLAHVETPLHVPEVRLLQGACQASSSVRAVGEGVVDALWYALADYLGGEPARQVEARTLLLGRVGHMESSGEVLSWGLRYLVRGDLYLGQGQHQTLDHLCERLVLPPLPLLDVRASPENLRQVG